MTSNSVAAGLRQAPRARLSEPVHRKARQPGFGAPAPEDVAERVVGVALRPILAAQQHHLRRREVGQLAAELRQDRQVDLLLSLGAAVADPGAGDVRTCEVDCVHAGRAGAEKDFDSQPRLRAARVRGPKSFDLLVRPRPIAALPRLVRIGKRCRVRPLEAVHLRSEREHLAKVFPKPIRSGRSTFLLHQPRDVVRRDLRVLRPPDGVPDPVEPTAHVPARAVRQAKVALAPQVRLDQIADRARRRPPSS